MKKRGQITLFILIGLIIVIAFFLLFYLKQKEIIFKPKPPLLPTELAPLDAYVKACIEKVSGEAVAIIGTTGGYIYYPDFIKNDMSSYLLIAPTEHGMMPYWRTLEALRIPPLQFIAEQMERYVNENLESCLQNFTPFVAQYNIVEKSEPKADVEFGDEATLVKVDYALSISDKQGRKVADIEEFKIELPYRIKTIHQIAEELVKAENTNKFMEYTVIDLIALDEDIPLNGVELSCKKKRWRTSEVENKLKTLIRVNLPKIRVERTSYPDFPADQPYLAKHFVWDPLNLNYKDFSVSFSFSEKWPFYFYVRPNKGGWLESGMQRIQRYLPFVCIQSWQFSYDLRFPIVVSILDRKNNYLFSFALELGIERNYPAAGSVASESYRFRTEEPTEAEYCSRKQTLMTIFSYDNVSNSFLPIDDVELEFTCLKYTCPLGKTSYESGGAVALLKTYVPRCTYGILKAKKDGYKEGTVFISTEVPGEVSVYLTPIKKVKVKVVKHRYDFDSEMLSPDAEELGKDEIASINVKRKDHEAYTVYPAEFNELELLAEDDFSYNVTIHLTLNGLVIGGLQKEVELDWDELSLADEIVFHVAYADVKNEDDMLRLMSILPEISELVPLPELR